MTSSGTPAEPHRAQPISGSARNAPAATTGDPTDPSAKQPCATSLRVPLPRRLVAVLGLLLLAPVCAEYVVGYDTSTGDPARLLAGLAFLAPLYGCAAIVIREVARRSGRGWPAIVLLALAFSLLQAGLVDQSLFNPSYRDIDYLDPMQRPTHIPALGISAYTAASWIIGHVVWTISVPIAIVESFVTHHRRTEPWLGRPGLAATSLLFLAGAAVILQDHVRTEQYVPTVWQLAGAATVVVALAGAAFATGRRSRPASHRRAPGPLLVGTVAFAALFLPTAVELVTGLMGIGQGFAVDWRGVALFLAPIAVLAALLVSWSRRRGWGAQHRLAAAGGALLTNVVIGFFVQPLGDVSDTAKLAHNTAVAAGALTLLGLAALRTRRKDGPR